MSSVLQSTVYRRFLDRLSTNGSLAASQIPSSLSAEIERLIENGVLDWQRSGSGRRLVLKKADALAKMRKSRFPDGPDDLPERSRSAGVAAFRNSKASQGVEGEPILIRSLRGGILVRNGIKIDVCALTQRAGVCAVLLSPGDRWHYTGKLITVENLECFLQAEHMGVNFDTCVYTMGRMSRAFLAWIAELVTSGATITHCGDYDPTGLDEFLRLQAATDNQATLHVPDTLAELFKRYSREDLLEGRSSSLLHRLRDSTHPGVKQVLALIHTHNAGLEQEALFLGDLDLKKGENA